ncbi:MAG: helix-turn-helix transcriptional regulator [Tabrizicola sp.]|nr:helix-turn-helix transcriptional regulator [Tabrizicola sp.]
MLRDEVKTELARALKGLRQGDAGGWAALEPLTQLSAQGFDVTIDFSTEAALGAPVILARERIAPALPDALTPRQAEVARALAEGLSTKTIAQRLGIAPSTAKDHIAAVMAVLGAKRRAEVAALIHGIKPR